MRGSGGSKEVAVMQCMIQVVGSSRYAMHGPVVVWKKPLCKAWSSGSREEAVIQCMVQVVVGKKPLYNA